MDKRTLRILEFDKIIEKLTDKAASELGKELATSLVPNADIDIVRGLLEETSAGVDFIVKQGSPPLGGIHDVRGSLKRAEIGSVLNPGELMRIGDTLRAAENLSKYAKENRNADFRSDVVSGLIKSLVLNKRIEEKIRFSILSEEEVADGASSALRNIRRQIKSEQGAIKDKLDNLIRSTKYQKFMQDSIVTMRQDRYVVPVKQEYRSEIPGIVHDSSSSGATIFVEPMAVVEANNKIRQLQIKEREEIERILRELTDDVLGIIDGLTANMAILARLDFIFAKAKLSLALNCTSPVMNENGRIQIKRGRHPLIDPKAVVPIDLWIGDEFKTLVITGPNTGGKTVTLKTTGLFALMAQAGLHLPADDETKMSVFKNIFADIGDEQSIEQSLSTFSSHMKNIVGILKKADDTSLVLLDELGAGTDPTEGAALAMSVLERLHAYNSICLATTHYSELKTYAFSADGVENASCEFDVETLKPTFRLLIGIPGRSNAFAISKRLGLDDGIIERAKEFLTGEQIKFEDMLLGIEKNRADALKEKQLAEVARAETEALKRETEAMTRRLGEQKEQIIKEARFEARKILSDAKDEADSLIKQLRATENEKDERAANKQKEEIRIKLSGKKKESERMLSESLMPGGKAGSGDQGVARGLKKGDTVLIVNVDKKGTVLETPEANGEVLVQAGILKISVKPENLRFIDEQKKETDKVVLRSRGGIGSKAISPEIDLRGLLQDEAVALVDKYLDDVVMSGLTEVRIIHGKGTGALRQGVRNFLKTNRNVKSFRAGGLGEGDTGVTVVELKH